MTMNDISVKSARRTTQFATSSSDVNIAGGLAGDLSFVSFDWNDCVLFYHLLFIGVLRARVRARGRERKKRKKIQTRADAPLMRHSGAMFPIRIHYRHIARIKPVISAPRYDTQAAAAKWRGVCKCDCTSSSYCTLLIKWARIRSRPSHELAEFCCLASPTKRGNASCIAGRERKRKRVEL